MMIIFLVLLFSIPCIVHCECSNAYYISDGSSMVVNHSNHRCVDVYSDRDNVAVLYRCIQLSDFLRSAGNSACELEINFSEGYYVLTTIDININVSLTMEAATTDSNVTLSCLEKERKLSSINASVKVNLMSATGFPSGYVVLKGIHFIDCVHSIKIDHVEDVLVENCTIRGIKASGLDFFNCLNITVVDSIFADNNVSTINDAYRGGAAGLSIGYRFHNQPQAEPNLLIRRCKFMNNHAQVSSDFSDQIDKALNAHTYPARGAALSIIIVEFFARVTAKVEFCVLSDNYAEAFGGAVYIIVSGDSTNHSLTFSNSEFLNNECSGGGGATFIGFLSTSIDTPTEIEYNNCKFVGNQALSSGGVLIVRTQGERKGSYGFVVFRSSQFSDNIGRGEGAAIVFGSLQKVQTRRLYHNSIIENCSFFNNTSVGGIVIVGFTNVESFGNCQFISNNGPALRVTGAVLEVKGNITFVENSADVSGKAALYLTALGQVKIYRNSYLSFINNRGSIGAAIRVESQTLPQSYLDTVDNPLCFLQYEDINEPPSNWEKGLIYFSGNVANLGAAIFASSFSFCSYDASFSEDGKISKVFDLKQVPEWPVFNFSVNYNQYHYGKEEDRRYYLQTPAVSVEDTYSNEEISLRPNVQQSINITGLDQFGNPTFYIARILDNNNSLSFRLTDNFGNSVNESFRPPANYMYLYTEMDAYELHYNPNLLAIYPGVSIETEYSIEIGNDDRNFLQDEIEKEMLIEVQNLYGVVYDRIEVKITTAPCQPGYELRPSEANPSISSCECVGAAKDDFAVLECGDNEDLIVLRDDYWSGRSNGDPQNQGNTEYLAVHTCPATYCQCLTNSEVGSCDSKYYYADINLQCHPPREGPLCGICGNGTIITVIRFTCSDNCILPAEYTTYILAAVLVIVDSAVIVGMLLAFITTEITLPNKFKSLLFYVQTVYVTTEYFPISFWNSRQYMLYIANFLSLFFPFDFCFIPSTPSVISFTLRFIPTILTIVIVLIFCFFRKARRKLWHGVWTLILLLYPSLVYTCMMLLNCPQLPDSNGQEDVMRWFLDASITCFRDTSHSVLAAFAIVFLIFSIVIILSMAILLLIKNTSFVQERKTYLLRLVIALKAGYRSNMEWMSCFELIKRIILLGVVIGGPGRTVAPIYVISILLVVHLYAAPYTDVTDNIFESAILLNYVILLASRYCQALLDGLSSYSGVMVPSTFSDQLPFDYNIVAFFSFFYYLPILISVLTFCFCMANKIWRKCMIKRRKVQLSRDKNASMRQRDCDRYFRHHSNHVVNKSGRFIPVTNINTGTIQ